MSKLKKDLTLFGLTMIAVGACVGSGIFITPADSVAALGHQGWVLIVWAVGGFITLCGALTFAELGSRYPNAGGVYVYIKEAFGPLPAFLYGWVILLIVNTGAMGALGMALVSFLDFFYPIEGMARTLLIIAVLIGLTAMNVLGVKISQWFASLFTGLKLLSIAFIVLAVIILADPPTHDFILNPASQVPDNLVSAILLAFVGVFWSFGGWYHATYLAAETVDAQRTVPKALIFGSLIVTATYLAVIAGMMYIVPSGEMALSERIAGDALAMVFDWGGKLVSIFIIISIFGTIGIYTMSAPRVYYAMAKDGVFFSKLAEVHPTYKTPHYAMIFQCIWAIVLVLIWGSFSRMITFVTFMDIVFLAVGAASIFVIRKNQKSDDIPFKLRLYPWIPLLFLAISIAFVINTAIILPQESFVGIALLIIGVPVFYYFYKRK